jgi:hypothetical protein
VAVAASGLITDSVAGAALTAVPGGVWASFRTGMLGLTIHLRQTDLAVIAPPGLGIAQTPATGIFHWPMYATTVYGGGALWLANQTGIVACLNPRTGKVRAREKVLQGRLIYRLLAADPVSRQVFAVGARGLVQISPPRRCWAAPSTKAPGTAAGTLVRTGGPAPAPAGSVARTRGGDRLGGSAVHYRRGHKRPVPPVPAAGQVPADRIQQSGWPNCSGAGGPVTGRKVPKPRRAPAAGPLAGLTLLLMGRER